jgi:hypothetical protein
LTISVLTNRGGQPALEVDDLDVRGRAMEVLWDRDVEVAEPFDEELARLWRGAVERPVGRGLGAAEKPGGLRADDV